MEMWLIFKSTVFSLFTPMNTFITSFSGL